MDILRTPDDACDGLPGYDFERHYADVPTGDGGTLRVHYVEAGDPQAPPVVMLHGNPSWSYLWRYAIPKAAAAGFRVIAPDLVGMGMSDKPASRDDYTVPRHVEWMRALLVDRLDLRDMTLVVHDWGGPIGLPLFADHADRIAAAVISNTGFFTARDPSKPSPALQLPPEAPPKEGDEEFGLSFEERVRFLRKGMADGSKSLLNFIMLARSTPEGEWEPWHTVQLCMVTPVSERLLHAYRAPYIDGRLAIGPHAFASRLLGGGGPSTPEDADRNWRAWQNMQTFEGPINTIYSDKDAVAPNGYRQFIDLPGAKGQPHTILKNGGHFLQEDLPDGFADTLTDWLRNSVKPVL